MVNRISERDSVFFEIVRWLNIWVLLGLVRHGTVLNYGFWVLGFGFFINEVRRKEIDIEEQVILWRVGVRHLYNQILVIQF